VNVFIIPTNEMIDTPIDVVIARLIQGFIIIYSFSIGDIPAIASIRSVPEYTDTAANDAGK
jgi:hypothetical protein